MNRQWPLWMLVQYLSNDNKRQSSLNWDKPYSPSTEMTSINIWYYTGNTTPVSYDIIMLCEAVSRQMYLKYTERYWERVLVQISINVIDFCSHESVQPPNK